MQSRIVNTIVIVLSISGMLQKDIDLMMIIRSFNENLRSDHSTMHRAVLNVLFRVNFDEFILHKIETSMKM